MHTLRIALRVVIDKSFNMGPIRKYLWILTKLRLYKRLTFEQLSEMWIKDQVSNGEELTNRSFHKYLRGIEDMFDINIVNTRCGSYQYYIEGLESLKNNEFRSWLLDSYAVVDQLQVDKRLQGRVFFEDVPSGQQWLTVFLEAIRQNMTTTITYQRYVNGDENTYDIEPYALKLFNRRWYVIARNPYLSDKEQKEVVRIYGLDRMKDVEITTMGFVEPEPGLIENMFKDSFGILADEDVPVQRVVIKAWDPQWKYISSLPLHKSQKEIARDDESVTFEYMVRPTFDFLQELLAQTDSIEVLEPQSVRDEMHNFAKNMYYHYKDDEKG